MSDRPEEIAGTGNGKHGPATERKVHRVEPSDTNHVTTESDSASVHFALVLLAILREHQSKQ